MASKSGVSKDRYMQFCTVCSKGFKDRYALKIHFRIHTGEKSFVCNICGCGFTQKAHHSEEMKQVTQENNCVYTCFPCDGAFRALLIDRLDVISVHFLHILFHMEERILTKIDAGLGGNENRHIKPPTETQPRMHTGRHKGLSRTLQRRESTRKGICISLQSVAKVLKTGML
ncbi:gastrula zinc finger protein xLCGF3.1-like [Cimex lectularius]|uniref:C2H2-type domain-containing protein n=1 Tax=Cimex lectularius TaxID=79782 RepID=A0A8I6ST78_CIMLE|nr:gastrula zinc finger protein xLCGF3.1-like [Cimex lectularius]